MDAPVTTTQQPVKYSEEQVAHALAFVERNRARERAKYERNKERRLAYARQYYETNKERISEAQKAAYALKHPKKNSDEHK